MQSYKITNESENHAGMQYKTGLNTNIEPFNPQGSCTKGGIYFSTEDILGFQGFGCYLRKVTIPEEDKVYKNPTSPRKLKAHRVILGEREEITEDVLLRLVDEGANIQVKHGIALSFAAAKGHLRLASLLLERWVNVHSHNDFPLMQAILYNHEEMVEKLLEAGADVNARKGEALRKAAMIGNTAVISLLIDHEASLSAFNTGTRALRYAACSGRLEAVELLLEYVDVCDEETLGRVIQSGFFEISRLLSSKCIIKDENETETN